MSEFSPALFDLEGNRIPAVRFSGRFGWTWKLTDPPSPGRRYFNESRAQVPGAARSHDAGQGYYVGRIDSRNGVIDNGIGVTNLEDHYKILEGNRS